MEGMIRTGRTAVSIACVSSEIQTEHLANMNVERYHYVNPLSCVSEFGSIDTRNNAVLVRKPRVIGPRHRGETE
jgi:hypothetical protein